MSNNNSIEIFKDVPGYEGYYQVSNLGRVKSSKKAEKYLIPALSHGYCRVGLSKKNIKKFHRIHRLVALVFIPNLENKPFINHKDGVRSNNVVENIEWCTQSENQLHKYAVLGYKQHQGIDNRLSIKVNQYSKSGIFIKTYDCIRDAQRDLLINNSNIIDCCKGTRKSAGGFLWEYTEIKCDKIAA